MNKETTRKNPLTALKELREELEHGKWSARRTELWGGAGVIVAFPGEEIDNDSIRIVRTPHAEEVSAMFYDLKAACAPALDYLNKFTFYGALASAVESCRGSLTDILEAMVDAAEDFILGNDDLIYFAYGSNMDTDRMAARCPGAAYICRAVLQDYRLAMDVRGYATVIPAPGKFTEGMLWRICRGHLKSLDRYEGVALGCYRREVLPVHSHYAGRVKALVYISEHAENPEKVISPYAKLVLKAAETIELSEGHLERMRQIMG